MLRISVTGTGNRTVSESCVITLAAGDVFSVDLASGGHWYGHGFSHVQPYPLETGTVVNDQFAVNNIQSPIWMCSAGYALLARTTARLAVNINKDGDGKLSITAPDEAIEIHVLRGRDLPDAHRALLAMLGGMQPAPPSALLGDAFFCTWTQYPRCITQQRILDFARDIRSHGYPCSTLIIDDRWESCFGELTFATKDFPDPRAMVQQLAELDIVVWLWVTPFVNQEAATFTELSARGLLVPHRDGNGAALFRWWGGTAGLIDVTNPAGRAWFSERLRCLKEEVGVAGFKIDGGDFKYQPSPEIAAWHNPQGPSGYSDALLAIFDEL
ncbi:MAG TPA: TIM-barrel domain-containing protein, partial [Armatimonadota bacterium]|nr:TIM-barrel domain-containing protein [Armatimonadota bacterium]